MDIVTRTRTTNAVEASEARIFMSLLCSHTGYLHPRPLPGGRYGVIAQFLFTYAIITGRIGDFWAYDNRWCYRNFQSAKDALDAWDGLGEPIGWHRHPMTGRRRETEEEILETRVARL